MDYIGIDIGSTCAKVVVMDEDEKIRHQSVQPTRVQYPIICLKPAIYSAFRTFGKRKTTKLLTKQ